MLLSLWGLKHCWSCHGEPRETMLSAALKNKSLSYFYVVTLLFCRIAKCLLTFISSPHCDVSDPQRNCSGVIFFILFVLWKSSYFDALVKNVIPGTFSLPGGGTWMHCFHVLFPSLFLFSQVQVLCLTRGIQCVLNAAAAWLDTWWLWFWIPSKQPLCSGLNEHWTTVPTGLFMSCNAAI